MGVRKGSMADGGRGNVFVIVLGKGFGEEGNYIRFLEDI